MKQKRTIANRIRGWLPKAPALPDPQRKGPASEHTKVPAKPDFTAILDRRMQLSNGMVLGLGIALILVGFLGWSSVNNTYRTLENFFLAGGLDTNYYLFRDLINQMAVYLTLMSCGACALRLGALTLRSRAVRRLFYRKGPHYRLGGGLMGGGGALALSSMHFLFKHILTSDYFELQLFFVFFTVGAVLWSCGFFASSRGTKNAN